MSAPLQEPGGGRRAWALWLLLAATVQLFILWLVLFTEGPLPEKAVRYQGAARLFAPPARTALLAEAEKSWFSSLPQAERPRLRRALTVHRLTPVYNGVLRLLCAAWPGAFPPYSYSIPVKVAYLLLFLAALGWLFFSTLAHPADAILAFAAVMAAGLGLGLAPLAPAAQAGRDLLHYGPEAPAAILLLAGFAAFARGRPVLVVLSLLLASLWHAGFAVLAVPCAAAAFGVTLCDRAGSRHLRGMMAALTGILAIALYRFHPAGILFPILIPAGFMVLFLLAGPAAAENPLWRSSASLAAFLFFSLILEAVLQRPAIDGWLTHRSLQPETDLSANLDAIRQAAGLALILCALVGVGDRFLPGRLSRYARLTVLLGVATAALAAATVSITLRWPAAGRHAALFLHAQEGLRARIVPPTGLLPALDPRQEALFHAALGDFLLSPDAPTPAGKP